ncbi:hypothetical protein [Paenibacillus periandrae]|uniref:hypothetical protein n=1 Tax=Paenibacillus periandrae TaxID=1761741 RepID=UPI001F094650|nr:hypothetical protein [Paenibacillus periandrae]
MAKFIIAFSMIILVFYPIAQYTLNQANHNRMDNAIEIVHKHVQQARTEGYFTPSNIDSMKNELSLRCNVDLSKIVVNVTTSPKYRFNAFDQREMIDYDVQIPISEIIAMASYFGFTNTQNQNMYPVRGSAPSEVLAP